jgi:uncharacterized protein (DUF1800 family)
MKLSRREAIQLGLVGTALTGCAPIARQFASEMPDHFELPAKAEPVHRWVNRLSYGPTPGEIARVAALGFANYLNEQLNPTEEEPAQLTMQLYRLDAFRMDSHEMQELPLELVLSQLQQGTVLRAVYSPHQLRERMVEFWSDHFNIYGRKGNAAFRKGRDDLDVIRKHALGKFPDLIRASAHSPAMLGYLDNQVNVRGVANENYARELMELHTLGVHGGYTQQDVQEVARCFTGWGLEDRFLRPKGKFRFDPDRHDDGLKNVLGHQIGPGGGQSDGEAVLDILANHPSTAKFICTKLCRYFLRETRQSVVDSALAEFQRTQGDIKLVLQKILTEENLAQSPPVQKRPYDFIVSSIRAIHAQTDGAKPLQSHLEKMGMPLFQWPMPDGYPVKVEAWTGTLLARWNFIADLVRNGIGGTVVDIRELENRCGGQPVELVLGSKMQADRVAPMLTKLDFKSTVAACLCSPEFQWR